jgi:hypothetical protein
VVGAVGVTTKTAGTGAIAGGGVAISVPPFLHTCLKFQAHMVRWRLITAGLIVLSYRVFLVERRVLQVSPVCFGIHN